MKKITVLLLLVAMTGLAQVKGNKEIVSKIIDLGGLTNLEMGIYADVIIDQSSDAQMTITADSNLQELIDTEVVDGRLVLSQLEWIQPSQRIKITIGAPDLKRLEVGINETVLFKNVDNDNIALVALNGKIIAVGTANSASIDAESGVVDASNLEIEKAYVNIWGRGKAIVNASELVESKLNEDARLKLVQQPVRFIGDTNEVSEAAKIVFAKAEYINIKIKNNSFSRNHFAVKGPKQDGSSFGYGFPMMPGATKKERWTVGTKVYKVNSVGMRKLLITVTAEDENTTIKLFDKD